MINTFLIIHNSGSPLYFKTNRDENVNTLLGGFLGTFQMFAANMDRSKINKIELDTKTYFYSIKDPIIAVIEAQIQNQDIDNQFYSLMADRLAEAFLIKYPKQFVCEWNGDLGCFTDFGSTYDRIINELSQMQNQSQKDFITKYFAEAASDSNIKGVVVFDLKQDEIIASDIPSDFTFEDFASFGSMLFNFVDKLGKELKAGNIDEMLLRAKNYWIGGKREENLAVFMIFNQSYFGKVMPDFVQNYITKVKE